MTPEGGSQRRSHLEKIKIPQFSGKCEDWGEFSRVFKELTKHKHLADPVYLSILQEALPQPAKSRVVGVTTPKEAWKRLDQHYGDRTVTIINARQKLLNTSITKGTNYEQLEMLCQAVEQAETSLAAVNAGEFLFEITLSACSSTSSPWTFNTGGYFTWPS